VTMWTILIASYIFTVFVSFMPVACAFLAGVKLNEGGSSFESSKFSPEGKTRLINHYSRLQGTLGFWKKQAIQNQRFHYYCLFWIILSSTLMPFLTQAIDASDPASKWLLTVISAHVALMLAFHRSLNVAERYKAFRHGESEFYDLYRRFLDLPESFGENESKQIESYFEETEIIRKFVRNAETDSIPAIDDVKEYFSKINKKV
jgi:hypothetical protein